MKVRPGIADRFAGLEMQHRQTLQILIFPNPLQIRVFDSSFYPSDAIEAESNAPDNPATGVLSDSYLKVYVKRHGKLVSFFPWSRVCHESATNG
jgi:hypothetical protein